MKDVGIFFWGFLTPKTGNELKNIIIFEFDMTENFVCNTCKITAGASIKGGQGEQLPPIFCLNRRRRYVVSAIGEVVKNG